MSKQLSTEEFDSRFDEGEGITAFLDTSAICHPNCEKKTANVNFPLWMVNARDTEAKTLGASRQALIKTVLGRHLQERKRQLV
uniref:Helix-turn-helix protein, CopG family n=1 Tax=Nitratidesulfovibrio vulgaris (strain DSM 19637 / Miyazaki F) TaxID=883 RepID=B8DM80_NITV9